VPQAEVSVAQVSVVAVLEVEMVAVQRAEAERLAETVLGVVEVEIAFAEAEFGLVQELWQEW
jgi:hypothetical protein